MRVHLRVCELVPVRHPTQPLSGHYFRGVTPYGKDKLPDHFTAIFMRLSGVRFGRLNCSRLTGFGVAWIRRIGCNRDMPSFRRTCVACMDPEGQAGVPESPRTREDYFDLIEWAASQPWCTGRIALMGVSYLAMSQWYVAALRPPHLRAIVPWEGVSDLYREFAFHGGIPETKFIPTWFRFRIKRGRNRKFPLAEDFRVQRDRHLLDDEYWECKRPRLERIDVAALICADWSDQGLHTRGSMEAFERISSRHKWLFTHGRKKWETFYSDEALAYQKQFLDHFLRDADNGQNGVPPVRLEIRKAYYEQEVRHEKSWPLSSIQPVSLHLCANTARMQREPAASEGEVSYRSTSRSDRACFSHRFERATELIGSMRLRLWWAPPKAMIWIYSLC